MKSSHSTGQGAYGCTSIARVDMPRRRSTVLRISPFCSFTKSMASAFAHFGLVVFVWVLLSSVAAAKNDRLAACRDADRDVRIAGCTEIIVRGSLETKRNLITAYL